MKVIDCTRLAVAAVLCGALLPSMGAAEPAHPILTISGSGSGADTILGTWSEGAYTNSFIPRQGPRNDGYGFVPAVVSGDTGWSWSPATPNQITSTPSGTVFPNAIYQCYTQAVTVMSGRTVQAPYYLRAGSTTAKSIPFALIDYRKLGQLRSDLNKLAPAYMNSGSTHATRNQAYARRIAIALLDWARWFPDYFLTAKNSASFINTSPSYILASDLQRASDHNGLAHEWADDELLAFDAIYDSPALAGLSTELGFDARDFIKTNLFCNEGDFIVYHVPVGVAIGSNLSGPYTVLALVARVLNRPDYIVWMDQYLDATVTRKIHRDGALSEGMGYSIGYINENLSGARHTRDYFLSRPADTPELQAIRVRATNYTKILEYGQAQWSTIALPNGQLPSFGDTPFNTYFSARNSASSALLPSYGTVCVGAGSASQAIQLNQNFSGDNNHMRSDTTAYVLWAFGNEVLGNIRYHNGTAGRQFTEQILAYNAVTIDRSDMSSPSANTYGNGDLTLYEPGTNGLAVTEIDGQRAYANKASRYQRIMLLNTFDLNRPYVVDVFRVTGGATHDYLFHGPVRYDSTWQCSFPLVTNSSLYPMLEGSEAWSEPQDSGDSFPYYGFWRDVSSNQAPGDFQITYRDTSSSHRDVRLWMTEYPGAAGATVYLGTTPVPARDNSQPANYWVNGLVRPSSIIRKRLPSGTLQDLFVSVVEPLNKGVSTISSVERLPVTGNTLESCALRITFADGRVDTCLVNLRNPQVAGANTGSTSVSTADGQYSLTGRIGLHTTGPAGARVWAVNAPSFVYPTNSYTPMNLYYSGQIIGATRKLDGDANDAFITTTLLPAGTALHGKQLSLTFGSLSGSGTTGISEMFEIDQVLQTNGQYQVLLNHDHMLEIVNGFSVSGSGSDIWGTSDQFHYAWQDAANDLAITTRVATQANTHSWAKSGLMIRETTATNSSYVGLYVTPGNGVSMQYRNGAGTSAVDVARQTGLAAPYWLRLVRTGATFAGYSSPDGQTWTLVGQTTVAMAAGVRVGFAVCAHDNTALNISTFDHFSFSLPLADNDIGAVGLAGSSGNSTSTVEQMAPLRTFTGTNPFEIALSSSRAASLPEAPTGLIAVPGNTQVWLSWANSGATSYNLKRSTTSGGPYATVASTAATSFTDTGLTNGTRYYYVLSAVNEVGEGPLSSEVSALPTASAPTGMVARLTFDDGTAADSSGYGNHGTLVNGAALVNDSVRGKVLSLNGTSSYVDLGNNSSLDLSANSQATITAWIKLAQTQNHNTILSKGEWKEAYSLLVKGDSTPSNLLWTGNDTSVFSGDPVPLNTWTHVAVTIQGDLTTFYINGQLSGAANQDRGNPIDTTTRDVCLGREQYSGSLPAGRWFFNGLMDDVRIYNRALSLAEIQSVMVEAANVAPAFTSHPLVLPPVVAGQPVTGSLAAEATDPNPGDTLAFSRVSGPTWLSVAVDGTLSGTPLSADVGTNNFVMRVTDAGGLFDETSLALTVNPAPPLISTLTISGTNLVLNWSGGIAPYQVQAKPDLQSNWQSYSAPILSNSMILTPGGATEFYRVQGH